MSRWFGSRTAAPKRDAGVEAIGTADALYAEGAVYEALAVLTEANRAHRDGRIEEALVRTRHEGFARIERSTRRPPPQVRAIDGPAPRLVGLTADELSPASLREGLARNGCVLVRDFVPAVWVERLVAGIDAALDAFDAGLAGAPAAQTTPWYSPLEPVAGEYRVGGRRNWVRKGGAMWTADSPRMLFELLELLETLGLGPLVTEYLGERPALSANKCTLRRTEPTDQCGDWHQDGAFLGADVRSLNVWLALAHCGVDAPGLDIVPRRLDHVVDTGTHGAYFDWAVGHELVVEVAGESSIARPEFGPGDVLLFDHLLLHRTASGPEMTKARHAMETWLFAPSTYPDGQIPLLY